MIRMKKLAGQYKFIIEETGLEVEARIIQYLDVNSPVSAFEWEISHFYKPEPTADFYKPSGMHGFEIADTEHSLLRYVKGFTSITEKNKNYKATF